MLNRARGPRFGGNAILSTPRKEGAGLFWIDPGPSMPFAHAGRAVYERKGGTMRATDDIYTFKPRTFHATTRRQPRWCPFLVAFLTERIARVEVNVKRHPPLVPLSLWSPERLWL
jgi:hypothetical protein